MFEKIKQIRKLSKKIEKETEPIYNENGKRVIKMTVKNDDGFLSPYSLKDKPILSSDTVDFLEHSVKDTDTDDEILFEITSAVIDETEKAEYTSAIKNYYSREIAETKTKLKRNGISSFIMLILGILVFALRIVFSSTLNNEIVLNVLDVVAWVFVWEATDLFFFKRSEMRSEQLKNLKIYTAELKFVDG